jgi:hypothetical protein
MRVCSSLALRDLASFIRYFAKLHPLMALASFATG